MPVLSTASNSILANSLPVALSFNPQSTLSPGFIWPTPEGVPVKIMSPVWVRRSVRRPGISEGERAAKIKAVYGARGHAWVSLSTGHETAITRVAWSGWWSWKPEKGGDLTSRVIIEDTCSINAGILNIMSEVHPSCFTSPFTYQPNDKLRPSTKARNESKAAWDPRARGRHGELSGKSAKGQFCTISATGRLWRGPRGLGINGEKFRDRNTRSARFSRIRSEAGGLVI